MNGNYYRPGPMRGQQFATTMIGRLIMINVAVFLLQNIITGFNELFALRPRMVVESFAVWQLASYMFLHGGFGHLFWNMLMLWMFGSTIESVWGPRNFLRYYIFCGIGGAVFAMIFSYDGGVVGASGAIFGLFLAYAVMFPDSHVYLMFLIPIKAKYLVAGLTVLQLINGLSGPAGVSYVAHLGGMAAGLLYFRGQLMQRIRFSMGTRRRWKSYVREKHTSEKRGPETSPETDNIDSILDKISEKGYPNLSPTEKRILENYSRKRKEESE